MLVCLDQRNGTGCGTANHTGALVCGQCGRSLRYGLSLHDPSTLVGRYRVVRLVGHGAFGAVYEAHLDSDPSQQVALKETFEPESIRAFAQEFSVLSGLHHPNLPRYHDMFELSDNGYLVMEFVPGQSLEDVLRRSDRPLAESQVMGYAIQLCDVLTYLHSCRPPIIHRDIKPANIRLTPEGLIKLVDFGIHKVGTEATASSRRALTPAYAPLEQYGRGRPTDPRSDIYSLGATLYHLLTGREPLPATERLAMDNDPLPPITTARPSCTPAVAAAVTSAMALGQERRLPSAEALKGALVGAPPSSQPRSVMAVAQEAVRLADAMGKQPAAPPRAAARAVATVPAPALPVRVPKAPPPALPHEASGLNWGAFLLSFFWAIGNRLWPLALAMFVPFVNVFVPFLLLFKGNEWAWRAGRWRDVAHFKTVQRTWTTIGVVVALVPVLLCITAVVLLGLLAS